MKTIFITVFAMMVAFYTYSQQYLPLTGGTLSGPVRVDLNATGASLIGTGGASNFHVAHDASSTVNLINSAGGGFSLNGHLAGTSATLSGPLSLSNGELLSQATLKLGANGSTIYLRPNGVNNSTGQVSIESTGSLTGASAIFSNTSGDNITLSKSNNFPAIRFNGANNGTIIEGGDIFKIYTGGVTKYTLDASGNNNWTGSGTFAGSLIGTSASFNQTSGIGVTIRSDWDASATNNSQLYITGNSNTNQQLRIGYATHANYGYIQALVSGTGPQNLALNPSGGNIGIGIATPEQKLDLYGGTNELTSVFQIRAHKDLYGNVRGNFKVYATGSAATDRMTFGVGANLESMTLLNNGNVGIGTSTPNAKQEVYLAEGGINQFRLSTGFNGGNYIDINPFITGVNNGGFSVSQNGTIRLVIDNSGSGNVGIGTTDPQGYKLAVAGKIRAAEIKVEALPWPDYVFHPSYKLPDLKSTEQFIKENKHLPEIPSAAQVAKDGINLGEMNAKLLQKIEELTLHLIEQNKRIEELERQIKK